MKSLSDVTLNLVKTLIDEKKDIESSPIINWFQICASTSILLFLKI